MSKTHNCAKYFPKLNIAFIDDINKCIRGLSYSTLNQLNGRGIEKYLRVDKAKVQTE